MLLWLISGKLMGFFETLKMALDGVTNNKFRSFLTLLGIIIGVSAVIIMVSLGSGTQAVVSGQFASLQTQQFYLSPNYELPWQQRLRLTTEDVNYIKESSLGTEEVLPFCRLYFKVKYENKERDNQIAAVMPDSQKATNLKIKYGRYIQSSDIKNKERVAVVGERFLRRLVATTNYRVTSTTDYSNLIGKYIYIDNKKFMIIGIMPEIDNTMAISDSTVLIPFTTARKVWRMRTRYIDFFLITYNRETSENDIMTQVGFLLDKKYGKTSTGKSRYTMQGLQQQKNLIDTIVTVFTYVLGGIAAISLLVGGIGVMNIMLVTVKERTREIGIRLAIGATRDNIRQQFLMEAIMLAVGGGLIGIICGTALSMLGNVILLQFFNWWQVSIPLWIILSSFAITTAIGIVFGYYPASKAARLDPIEALRYE